MTKKIVYGVCIASVLGTGFVGFPVFADDTVDISIVEMVDDGSGNLRAWEDIAGAMPGSSYSAIPRVQNNGGEPVTVLMCLSESAINSAGETLSLPANTFEISINGNWILDSETSTNASDPASGNCYRYSSSVDAGEVSEPVFSEVVLSSALANEYQGATFSLHLDAYAMAGSPDDGGGGEEGGSGAVDPNASNNTATPNNPDTGAAKGSGSSINPSTAFFALGAAALAVLGIHFVIGMMKNHKR